MPSRIRIRQMEWRDVAAIGEIDETSFPIPYTAGIWERERRNSLSHTRVAIEDGGREGHELIGYLNFWIILDEAQIHRIAVKEVHRRSGVAGLLLGDMFRSLEDMDMASVHLEVRESNQGAIKLYEKFGFMIKGRRERYYQETGEDALIFEAVVKKVTPAG